MTRSNDILQELTELSPGLAQVSPVMPYKVPAGYFNDFAGLMLIRLKTNAVTSPAEELEALSPLLAGLKKAMPFSVPGDYFEKFAIPQPKKQAPVRHISFPGRVFKYAAAAVVAGLIGLAVWLNVDDSTSKNAGLAKTEAVNFKDLNNISDTEIENFLDRNIGTLNFEPTVPSDQIREEDIRLMLTEVSDKELENYLNQGI